MVKPNLKSDVYLRYCSYHRPYTAPIITSLFVPLSFSREFDRLTPTQ